MQLIYILEYIFKLILVGIRSFCFFLLIWCIIFFLIFWKTLPVVILSLESIINRLIKRFEYKSSSFLDYLFALCFFPRLHSPRLLQIIHSFLVWYFTAWRRPSLLKKIVFPCINCPIWISSFFFLLLFSSTGIQHETVGLALDHKKCYPSYWIHMI